VKTSLSFSDGNLFHGIKTLSSGSSVVSDNTSCECEIEINSDKYHLFYPNNLSKVMSQSAIHVYNYMVLSKYV